MAGPNVLTMHPDDRFAAMQFQTLSSPGQKVGLELAWLI
jgi:hypothetical protein